MELTGEVGSSSLLHEYFLWGEKYNIDCYTGTNMYEQDGCCDVEGKREENTASAKTCLFSELWNRLFINVLPVCNILYNLLRTHQLLCFCIRDLKACRRDTEVKD